MTKKIYVYDTHQAATTEWSGGRKGLGLLKIGETRGSVDARIKAQMQGVPGGEYNLYLEEEAKDINGDIFSDHDIHKILENDMGCIRVRGTEWFECTLDEVKEALSRTKSGYRCGKPNNKRENKPRNIDELKRISPYNIIALMKKYPDKLNSLRDMGKMFKVEYNIENYSPLTLANKIGSIIKVLMEAGIVLNEGTFSVPKYRLVNTEDEFPEDFMSELINTNERVYNLEDLEDLIKSSEIGKSLSELHNITGIRKKSIQAYLSKLPTIRGAWIRIEGFNGKVLKFFHTSRYIQLASNEEFFEAQNPVYEYDGDISDSLKKRVAKLLKYVYEDGVTLRTLKGKIHNTTLGKIVLCIKKFFPEYTVVDLDIAGEYAKVVPVKYADIVKIPYTKRKKNLDVLAENILKYLQDNEADGITQEDIEKHFSVSSRMVRKALETLPTVRRYKERNKVDGYLEYHYYSTPKEFIHRPPTNYMYSRLDVDVVKKLSLIEVTDEYIEDVINRHPEGLRKDDLTTIIQTDNCIEHSIHTIWNIIKPLIYELVKDSRVVNNMSVISKNNRGWLLFPAGVNDDNVVKALTLGKGLDDIIASYLRQYPFGLPGKIIADKFRISNATLILSEEKSGILKKARIFDVYTNKIIDRYYNADCGIQLRDGEQLIESEEQRIK